MTSRVDVEEIETTRSEKLLAAVLCAFVLVGLLWAYFNVDVHPADDRYEPIHRSAQDREAGKRYAEARRARGSATYAERERRAMLVDRREAYRTALDEGRSSPALLRRYRAAQAARARAQARERRAREAVADLAPAFREAEARMRAAERRRAERYDDRRSHDDRVTVARRLALVLAALGAAYLLLARLRRRRSRWLPGGVASVAAAALLALVMAVDYLDGAVELEDAGVLVLAIAGVLMTLAAFAALQRSLARRLPERRVRRRECPFCGYPTGDGRHCEGCGRAVVGDCTSCDAPRRVGTRRCASCGAA